MRRIAADLVGFFGEDMIRLLLDGIRPGRESDLRMAWQQHRCHGSLCGSNLMRLS